MTLDQLRIFVAVAERQHVTRAAEALHVAQSAVSASVAALEGRHGAKLFTGSAAESRSPKREPSSSSKRERCSRGRKQPSWSCRG